jgi:hypothetical protein
MSRACDEPEGAAIGRRLRACGRPVLDYAVRRHGQGELEPIRDPRTNNHGYFHKAYRFHDAIGDFPFCAEIPAGQAGFPYTFGASNTINVNTTHRTNRSRYFAGGTVVSRCNQSEPAGSAAPVGSHARAVTTAED